MRNLNDFIRALGGIHNVLSGIAGKIDLIPVPGGGGEAEWTKIVDNQNTNQEIDETDYSEFLIYGRLQASGCTIPPIYIPKGTIPSVYKTDYTTVLASTTVTYQIYEENGNLYVNHISGGPLKLTIYAR